MRSRAGVVVVLVVAVVVPGCGGTEGQVAGVQPVPTPSITVLEIPTLPPTAAAQEAVHVFAVAVDGTLLPNPANTPGGIVVGATAEVVCAPGFGSGLHRVRSSDKDRVLSAYGVSGERGDYTIDHLVPVALGGSDEAVNLWPQPKEGAFAAARKNELEAHLTDLVCTGAVGIDEARASLVADWRAAYDRYPPPVATPVAAPVSAPPE